MSGYNPDLPRSTVLPGSPLLNQDCTFNDFARDIGFCRKEMLFNLQNANLTNPIHPCFQATRFASTIRYQDLDQALRLASHFLAVLLPEFYTILCAQRRRHRKTGKDGQPIELFAEPPKQLTAEQDFAVQEQLHLLAGSVDYVLDTSQDPSNTVSATCCEAPDKDLPSRVMRRGMCSTIQINHACYTRLAYSYYERKNDMVRYNYYCLELASSLVHELAHAATNLRCDQYQRKPHYFLGHTAKTSEEGFEVESKLFGGILIGRGAYEYSNSYIYPDGRHSEVTWPIVLTNWPDACNTLPAYTVTTVEDLIDTSEMSAEEIEQNKNEVAEAFAVWYAAKGREKIPPEVIVLEVLPAYAIQWNTDFLHWHQMFQDSFWDVKVKTFGREAALWPARERGIRWQLRPVQTRIVTDPSNLAGVPETHYVQFTGLVRRKGNEVADLDDLHRYHFEPDSSSNTQFQQC